MRVLVAPSGYKENLDAIDVAAAIAEGVRRACRDAEIVELPLVDGGEGTSKAMAKATGGTLHQCRVTGPVGDPIDAEFAMLGDCEEPTAVVELAAAAGLKLVPRDRRDPCRTTTRGVGEMIAAALDLGARTIVIGCGDSGVNDGGAGLAEALGARLLDREGKPIGAGGIELARLDRIEMDGVDPRLAQCRIHVACNIRNILTGPNGVARVFGPQKGAGPEDVEKLANALDHYAAIIERDLGVDVRTMDGGGASGGVGAGLHALFGAELKSRFDVLLPYFPLDEHLDSADLVLTAEGEVDFKSARGKIPAEVGERAKARGVPVIILAGTIGERAEEMMAHGISAYFSTVARPETLDQAMDRAAAEISLAAEHVMRTFVAGAAAGARRAAGDG